MTLTGSMRLTSDLAWVLGCVTLALACSGDGDGKGSHGIASQTALDGRDFVSTSVEGYELAAGSAIWIGFDGDNLGASAGCNSMSGPYRIDGALLRISSMMMTAIGCDPALHAQEDWLADLLSSSPMITLDEPELTLRTANAVITLLDGEVGYPDLPLAGTRWILGSAGNSDSITGGPGFDRATLVFDGSGSVAVFTACQSGTGRYSTEGSTIRFEGLSYDGVACSDASLDWVSETVLSVLDGSPVTYFVDGGNLTIERGVDSLSFYAGG